jgi:hypothetical protein
MTTPPSRAAYLRTQPPYVVRMWTDSVEIPPVRPPAVTINDSLPMSDTDFTQHLNELITLVKARYLGGALTANPWPFPAKPVRFDPPSDRRTKPAPLDHATTTALAAAIHAPTTLSPGDPTTTRTDTTPLTLHTTNNGARRVRRSR